MNEPNRTLVIAEAGVNHNGDLRLALDLVDMAADCGADIVKFQTFDSKSLATEKAALAEYQIKNLGRARHEALSQREMLKQLELTNDVLFPILERCNKRNIEFMSTAFDVQNLQALVDLGMRRIKIASGEISNLPLLYLAAQCQLPVILSTGMCALEEVGEVVEKLVSFNVALQDLTILQCTTNYPAKPDQMNLLAMRTMAEKFNVCVGLSDHSEGPEAALAAVALGATVIEKHITLDRTMEGPDHICSMEPNEFSSLVNSIRVVERSLGDGKKKVLECEREHRKTVRKSIVARRNIKKGDVLSEENITTKRPGTGLSPMHWFDVIGRVAHREYLADDFIECPEKSV